MYTRLLFYRRTSPRALTACVIALWEEEGASVTWILGGFVETFSPMYVVSFGEAFLSVRQGLWDMHIHKYISSLLVVSLCALVAPHLLDF